MNYCGICGASLISGAKFCPRCGHALGESSPPPPASEESAAITSRISELRGELASIEDSLEIQSFGLYEPRFNFDTASEYAKRLKEIRVETKELLRKKAAIHSPKDWVVDGSLAKGRKMMDEQSQLMLRAFNGDCDAAIARTKHDNVSRLEKRIVKAFAAINKLGATKQISITDKYLQSRLAELHLVHEHREKTHQEREEQRAIREEMKEEQKAEKEIEKARKDAEKDEERHAKALEKARVELRRATGNQVEKLEALVGKLETELANAIDRKAKSIARAQLTRSGHVYVLSNIGSFGEGIYKIGMTRRLEPLERVHELGDSSVPFRFDVHAMIYAEDAPALERALHLEFESQRVNRINLRREYFRVSLEDIMAAVARHHGTVTFVTHPEAEEYRRSRAMTAAVHAQQGTAGGAWQNRPLPDTR